MNPWARTAGPDARRTTRAADRTTSSRVMRGLLLRRSVVPPEAGERAGGVDEAAAGRAEVVGRGLDRGLHGRGIGDSLRDEERRERRDVGRGHARALEPAVAELVVATLVDEVGVGHLLEDDVGEAVVVVVAVSV